MGFNSGFKGLIVYELKSNRNSGSIARKDKQTFSSAMGPDEVWSPTIKGTRELSLRLKRS